MRGATGVHWAKLGDWTPEIRINADDGWGGCRQTFALLDPTNRLADLTMKVTFAAAPNSDAGQCGDPGERSSQTTRAWASAGTPREAITRPAPPSTTPPGKEVP